MRESSCMRNDSNVAEWLRLANMDLDTAQYVFGNMYPKPCEIICYHCQQATEKFLKALALANDQEPLRTHDLVVLAKSLGGLCTDSTVNFADVRHVESLWCEGSVSPGHGCWDTGCEGGSGIFPRDKEVGRCFDWSVGYGEQKTIVCQGATHD